MTGPRHILLTGAAGRLGTVLRASLPGNDFTLRSSDIVPIRDALPDEEVDLADLERLDEVIRITRGVDTVLHFGGVPREDEWTTILNANIVGTYNVFEAARRNNVRRVVFASSNHVVGYYRRTATIGPFDPTRPDSRYGVSKVFGEALGRMYADKYGMSVICLRIGCCFPAPTDRRMLSAWIGYRDLVQLVQCSIDAMNVRFAIVYGVSANTRNWWRNPSAEKIAYAPRDTADHYAAEIEASQVEDGIAALFQGGRLSGLEFQGDPARVD